MANVFNMADVLVEQSDRILKEFLSWSEQNGLILSKKVCLNNNHLLKNPQVLTTGTNCVSYICGGQHFLCRQMGMSRKLNSRFATTA